MRRLTDTKVQTDREILKQSQMVGQTDKYRDRQVGQTTRLRTGRHVDFDRYIDRQAEVKGREADRCDRQTYTQRQVGQVQRQGVRSDR